MFLWMWWSPYGWCVSRAKHSIASYVHRLCDEFKFGIILRIDKSVFGHVKDVTYINVCIHPVEITSVRL